MDFGPSTAAKNAGVGDAVPGTVGAPPPLPNPPPVEKELALAEEPRELGLAPTEPPEPAPVGPLPEIVLEPSPPPPPPPFGESAAQPAQGPPPAPEQPSPVELWLAEFRNAPSWLLSMIVHLVLLMVLALGTIVQSPHHGAVSLMASSAEPGEALESIANLQSEPTPVSTMESAFETTLETALPKLSVLTNNPNPVDVPSVPSLTGRSSKGLAAMAGGTNGSGGIGGPAGALAGRSSNLRGRMVNSYGGTEQSEAAVERALKWLAEHQLADGSWTFQHQTHPRCHGQCGDPGFIMQARVASTGLGLLPFLGAGNTQTEGKYKGVVRSAVYYLIKQIRNSPQGGALNDRGGKMYSHGIASIALCEAYGMSGEKNLAQSAQQVLNFICYAQDPSGGGWRYEPLQPGDTSVVGWQLMALKSGHMSNLQVPQLVFARATHFLDSVQTADGSGYGYLSEGDTPTTTAIGLLCRMYLGWKKDNPALARGVEALSNRGPSERGDLYYDYYATQVLRHWGGEPWRKWNTVLRDRLIVAQVLKGHETGSWYFDEGDLGSRNGGRLYCTAMAAMILEVYYRHMPLYGKRSTDEEFPD